MKKLIIVLIALVALFEVQAQHELGVGLGTSHLLGDFGGGPGEGTLFLKDIDFQSTRPSASIFYRYNFLKVFAIRGQFAYFNFASNDIYSAEESRFDRGLNSNANVVNGSVHLEFHFIPLKPCNGKIRVSPFLAGGVGFLHSNASVGGTGADGFNVNELQYIEGNESGFALNVPMSFGVKIKTPRNIVIGVEGSYWMAYTDKLDSYVRQNNDHFLSLQAQVSYIFCKGGAGGSGKMSREMRCPTYF